MINVVTFQCKPYLVSTGILKQYILARTNIGPLTSEDKPPPWKLTCLEGLPENQERLEHATFSHTV